MKNWFNKLKSGLSKSSSKFTEGINNIFTKRKLDNAMLDELEDLLLSSDLGIDATKHIISTISRERFDKEIDPEEIKRELAKLIENIVLTAENNINLASESKLKVVLVCGVNGNGKTTTIGKLANYYKNSGKKVAVAACDTFRAAAVKQLQIWSERANVKFISGAENADPASIAYRAVEESMNEAIDILFIDTAGRLHNKSNLMDELSKIVRVIKKLDADAPHESILVIDATTGQNAYAQVENFRKIIDITGLIITKLDGTAKAGILVALTRKFSLPVLAIGVGESIDDLQPFNAKEFAISLVLG